MSSSLDRLYQIKSNQIYLPAQNIKEKQLKNLMFFNCFNCVNTKNQQQTDYDRLWMLAGLKGRETALTWALKNEHKHNNDHVYNNMMRGNDEFLSVFLQRVRIACNAERCNSQSDSVRPSVIPSRSSIVSKRMKIRSCGFQHLVGQSL